MFDSIFNLIGNTPILRLGKLKKELGLVGNLFVKLEKCNISGSVKDRVAKNILLDGISRGLIKKDTLILEATSGNFGISLAAICASLDLNLLCVMPESASLERRKIIKMYGGNVTLTPTELGMKGSIELVEKMKKENSNVFVPSQFTNLVNVSTHYDLTGPEIYEQMNGEIDVFIASIGSGGTISGVGGFLKSKKNLEVIGVEPFESPLLTKGISNNHKIEGIGANFIPDILDVEFIDNIKTVSYDMALKGVDLLAKTEGILVGFSSGASLMVGIEEARLDKNKDKNILVILPDGVDRYLSKLMLDD